MTQTKSGRVSFGLVYSCLIMIVIITTIINYYIIITIIIIIIIIIMFIQFCSFYLCILYCLYYFIFTKNMALLALARQLVQVLLRVELTDLHVFSAVFMAKVSKIPRIVIEAHRTNIVPKLVNKNPTFQVKKSKYNGT